MTARPRHNPHPDANQPGIVEGLRKCGYTVLDISKWCAWADLLVWGLDHYRWDHASWAVFEVKVPGGKLTPEQRTFQEEHPGAVQVVESLEEALACFGRGG